MIQTLKHTARATGRPRGASWLARLSLFSALALSGAGCSQGVGNQGDDPIAEGSQAITASDILGFEVTSGWSASSGTVTSTTTHTQGNNALALTAPVNFTTLTSQPLASSTPGLAGLANTGASIAVDVLLPTSQPNPSFLGSLQMSVSCPSRGVFNQFLGNIDLLGRPLGVFQTYKFTPSESLRQQLTGAAFSDLTIQVALNAPAGAKGTYVFDNVRTKSPATEVVGSGPSIDLTATRTSAGVSTPGSATFTSGTIQIPQSFRLASGDSGTGKALLELGFGSTTSTSCTYVASADKTAYNFSSCANSSVAGDIVAASFARLTLQGASTTAPLSKVKAQLGYNLLGDQVGTKLFPAVPTFWGVKAADINTIATAFVQSMKQFPLQSQTLAAFPIPDYSKRHSNGAPVDTTNGVPPPPGDPPFHKRGDLNPGQDTNAFWTLDGNFTPTAANGQISTQFSMDASVGAVLQGNAFTPLEVKLNTTTSGTVVPTGVNTQSTTGTYDVFVFGNQIAHNQLTGTINIPIGNTTNSPDVKFQWAIFSVTGHLTSFFGADLIGAMNAEGPSFTVSPRATVGASVTVAVDVDVASVGLNATIQLINVTTPLKLATSLAFNSNPANCSLAIGYDLSANLTLSTLGGSVSVVGTLGPCPVCLKGSFTLFHWDPVPIFTQPIFDINLGTTTVPLPTTACVPPLSVSVDAPTAGSSVIAGASVQADASATAPPTPLQVLPTPVPCQGITWTSSDPRATFSPSAVGCSPVVVFGTTGTQTLTATAVSGPSTGSASVSVNVTAPAPGPVPSITGVPANGEFHSFQVQLFGFVNGGTGPVSVVWSEGSTVLATQTVLPGVNVELQPLVDSFTQGNHRVTLTATDSLGRTQSVTVVFAILVA